MGLPIQRIDFVIAGTQKGGTTALEEMLRQHPAVGLADEKELHFFDDDRFFQGDRPAYAAYHAHFDRLPRHAVLGEATPVYMYWEPAAERMWRYNPALKLVLILRNPIERAWSHWRMTTRRGEETLDFGTAIRTERERCGGGQHRFFSYIARGRYMEQLDRLARFFPENQMLVLRNEELRSRSRETLERVGRFLGVPLIDWSEGSSGEADAARMPEPDRAYLKEVFEAEIRALEGRFGWNCSAWLE